MEIQRDRKSGTLALSQRRFVEKLLELFGMSKAKPVKTPLAPHFLLSSEQFESRKRKRRWWIEFLMEPSWSLTRPIRVSVFGHPTTRGKNGAFKTRQRFLLLGLLWGNRSVWFTTFQRSFNLRFPYSGEQELGNSLTRSVQGKKRSRRPMTLANQLRELKSEKEDGCRKEQ